MDYKSNVRVKIKEIIVIVSSRIFLSEAGFYFWYCNSHTGKNAVTTGTTDTTVPFQANVSALLLVITANADAVKRTNNLSITIKILLTL